MRMSSRARAPSESLAVPEIYAQIGGAGDRLPAAMYLARTAQRRQPQPIPAQSNIVAPNKNAFVYHRMRLNGRANCAQRSHRFSRLFQGFRPAARHCTATGIGRIYYHQSVLERIDLGRSAFRKLSVSAVRPRLTPGLTLCRSRSDIKRADVAASSHLSGLTVNALSGSGSACLATASWPDQTKHYRQAIQWSARRQRYCALDIGATNGVPKKLRPGVSRSAMPNESFDPTDSYL